MLAEREAGNVAGLAMLRGKEIPYKDEGRGVLLDALLSPVQATIARHETQAGYQ